MIGLLDEAEQEFRSLIESHSTSPFGYVGLADIEVRRSRFDQARELVEKALELDATFSGAQYILGLAYRGLGLREQARRALEKGVGQRRFMMMDPLAERMTEYYVTLPARGQMYERYLARGQYDKAEQFLLDAMEVNPSAYSLQRKLARLYARQGQLARAIGVLRAAVQMDASNAKGFRLLAQYLARDKKWAEAYQAVRTSMRLDPSDAGAHAILGKLLLQQGRADEALQELNRAAPGLLRAEPYVLIGDIYARKGAYLEAHQSYLEATRHPPESFEVYLRLAEACLRLQRFGEAATHTEKAAQLAPDNPRVAELQARQNQLGGP